MTAYRTYTAAQRRRALAVAKQFGTGAAERKLKLPAGTIYRWQHAAAATNHTTGDPDAARLDQAVAFICGETKTRLEGYAAGLGVPAALLTARVAKFLHAAARGAVLGLEHRVPPVRS